MKDSCSVEAKGLVEKWCGNIICLMVIAAKKDYVQKAILDAELVNAFAGRNGHASSCCLFIKELVANGWCMGESKSYLSVSALLLPPQNNNCII